LEPDGFQVRLRITTALVLVSVLLTSGAVRANCAVMCASATLTECVHNHPAKADTPAAHVPDAHDEAHHHHVHGAVHASNDPAAFHLQSDCCSHSGTESHVNVPANTAELRAGLQERSAVLRDLIAAAKLVTTSSLPSITPILATTAASLSSEILRV
jgi:hypothetical protein